MKEHCNHHPTRLAHWRCPKCQQAYCPDCIIKRRVEGIGLGDENMNLCPKCMVEARWVGAANLIDPFWNRLPKFFVYPFHLQPIILMLSISLIELFVLQFGPIGLIVRIVLWGILFKYSFSALKATARGDLVPPKVNTETISKDFHQVFKQLGIYIAIVFIFRQLVVTIGLPPALLFLILALLFVPAMVILLVTTDSLLQALNPLIFIRLALRIGKGYLLMYFFLFLLGLAPAVLGQYLISALPLSLSYILLGMSKSYYTMISYHLMGYVILQYHQAIGYEVDYETFRDPELEKKSPYGEDTENPILKQVSVMVTEGKLDEAIRLIEQNTKSSGFDDLELSERYFNLLRIRKRDAEMLAHGAVHLDLLTRHNEKTKACQLYAQCIAQKNDFKPTADSLFKVGDWLNEKGKFKAAIGAYKRLIKAYPESSLVPESYFSTARILTDTLMEPEKARRILTRLIKNYPEDEIIPEAKLYLRQLQHP